MAKIHVHGQRFRRPRVFSCPRWTWQTLFGPASPYFPKAEKRVLASADQKLFANVVGRTKRTMKRLGSSSNVFGLIHGDLIQTNYLFQDGEARGIDFGDFGLAHYLYDIGITLFALWGRDDQQHQQRAFLEGYRTFRDLSADHEELINLFIAIRGVLLARVMLGAKDPQFDDVRSRYIERVIEGLRIWCG